MLRRQLGLFETIGSVEELLSLAVALGARTVPGWSEQEEQLTRNLPPINQLQHQWARERIEENADPLGDLFIDLLSSEERRPRGATYTPQPIIDSMLTWAQNEIGPARVVDPGTGSGRFLISAAKRFPDAQLVGVESDPIAAILARANLATHNLSSRSSILLSDYRTAAIAPVEGSTLFIGNPPYVRHHLLDQEWKQWLVATARRHHIEASQLAGLHVYFFLATAEHARPGDVGVFISASEWLDVNYGSTVRELLLYVLGAKNIQVIEPRAMPFPGTATTAVITGFEAGTQPPSIGLRRVADLSDLGSLEPDWHIHRERFEAARRWSPLTRVAPQKREGFVELGELCRVHRGQVTGANKVWIAGSHSAYLPDSVLYHTVTRARELINSNGALVDPSVLKQVIDIPADLDVFDSSERERIQTFLSYAKAQGADQGYVARGRKTWWSVGLRRPAPVLATYMARRPPAFVRNIAEVRHINIAHGLYPRVQLTEDVLSALIKYLSSNVSETEGRTYAGGLTKFEPGEMERLLVPSPELLAQGFVMETT